MFFLGSCFTINFFFTEVNRSREPELASKNGKSSTGELGASKNKSSSDPDKHTQKKINKKKNHRSFNTCKQYCTVHYTICSAALHKLLEINRIWHNYILHISFNLSIELDSFFCPISILYIHMCSNLSQILLRSAGQPWQVFLGSAEVCLLVWEPTDIQRKYTITDTCKQTDYIIHTHTRPQDFMPQ